MGFVNNLSLEKWGSSGAVIAAIVCPICFPKLAVIGALLGLGVLAPYESWFVVASQGFLALALIGHYMAYRRHGDLRILLLAALALLLVLGSLWLVYVEVLVYLGLACMVIATVWSVYASRRRPTLATAANPVP